jgi:hypothetical protein
MDWYIVTPMSPQAGTVGSGGGGSTVPVDAATADAGGEITEPDID